MDRRNALLDLARGFDAANTQSDWEALALLTRNISEQLPALARLGAWSEPERAALQKLRAIHARSFQLCSDEKQRLGASLGEMHARKEGWVAYALNSDMYQDGN